MKNSVVTLSQKKLFPEFQQLQRSAFVVLFFVTLSLLAWSIYVPLKSAVLASGYVRAEGYSKQVQHVDGGVVDRVWVREGDYVKEGTLLVSLDNEDIKTRLNAKVAEYVQQRAIAERLTAFLKGTSQVIFPPELHKLGEQVGQHLFLNEQTAVLLGQQARLQEQIEIFESRKAQLTTRVNTQQTSFGGKRQALTLLQQDLVAAKSLGTKKFIAQKAINQLERQVIELRDEQRVLAGQLQENKEKLAELELTSGHQITLAKLTARQKLQLIQQELPQLEKMLALLQGQLKRSQVVAQVSGIVSNLKVHNKGVAIPAGAHLMDIVPDQEQLVIEARLNPQDIDEMSAGLDAQVRLTAYNQRRTAPLKGKVIQVSPDRLIDDAGQPYYTVMIQLGEEALTGSSTLTLYPGMPAEAIIVTGERTLGDYLLAPLMGLSEKGMRES